MSKSLSVLVLLPMDEYNSFDTYREDDRLKQIYSEVPKAENYFKPLRIRSLYTSDKDLMQYFRKKYQLPCNGRISQQKAVQNRSERIKPLS